MAIRVPEGWSFENPEFKQFIPLVSVTYMCVWREGVVNALANCQPWHLPEALAGAT